MVISLTFVLAARRWSAGVLAPLTAADLGLLALLIVFFPRLARLAAPATTHAADNCFRREASGRGQGVSA